MPYVMPSQQTLPISLATVGEINPASFATVAMYVARKETLLAMILAGKEI